MHRKRDRSRGLATASALVLLLSGLIGAPVSAQPSAQPASAEAADTANGVHSATGFVFVKQLDQATCGVVNSSGFLATYFMRGECQRIDFTLTGSDAATAVAVRFVAPDGSEIATLAAGNAGGTLWRLNHALPLDWPAGRIGVQVLVDGGSDAVGESAFFLNALGASISVPAKSDDTRYRPGEEIPVEGHIHQLVDVAAEPAAPELTGVAAEFYLSVRRPDGTTGGPYGPYVADADGSLPDGLVVPADATAGIEAGPETGFVTSIGIDVVDATYSDVLTGSWANGLAGAGSLRLGVPADQLVLENKFVSSTGWVKPGETYPFRVLVRNLMAEDQHDLTVTVAAPDGTTFGQATPLGGLGSVSVDSTTITWTIPALPAATASGETVATLVVEATADSLSQDAEIVWKDLSTSATLTYAGSPDPIGVDSHGPKVIPPDGGYETARYGDKPFPMVPVDYRDRKHQPGHDGDTLAEVVNSPDYPGSTYNLYQEMSYGQLHPDGEVPSAGMTSAGFDYEPGFAFSSPDPTKGTCRGTTLGPTEPLWGTPAYPERISDGWYQLPGDTEYYGGDWPAFTATTIAIDQACGPVGKAVYDAAVIADPEIDYNQFDSDKDGVVDFFMMVFVGAGGNGASQLQEVPPYDNIWPHSSSLEFYYTDEETGLNGYISDDQLTDLEGTPQCWTNTSYTGFAACGSGGDPSLPAYVRVGPYNVNPEDAIEATSVIAHEYGHHLGLPDYYSTSYSAYNDWNLMASDYSQHMTIFSKQELGWVVPTVLQPGETRTIGDWEEIKNDTGQITWQKPNGEFYTLSAANGDQNVHNGEAYALKLPRRLIIDPAKVEAGASLPYLWWSGRGNDFNCTPTAGHNLDIVLPELEQVPEGTPITVSFKSSWDIEWDFDYGFTMVTTDGGSSYESLPSQNGYTTSEAVNPNSVSCLNQHDNGLTGTSGSYGGPGPADDTATADRAAGIYRDSPFVEDRYDLSAYAGESNVVLRFSYFTDPGLDRPGWFIDDLVVTAGDTVIYESDFTEEDTLRVFPGGCGNGMQVASKCTEGWNRIKADEPSSIDHAYYLELRDRSGFDFNGRGQSDRGDIGWEPGVLVEYTDESRGYGNNGAGMPPRQHYIDSQPEPGFDCGDNLFEENPPDVLTDPRCQDAAFTAASGDSHFSDVGWIDNFVDSSSSDGLWHFDYGCLTLDVSSLSGQAGNSEALPSDLSASATVSAGEGCEPFAYGRGDNRPPLADAQAKPLTAEAGQPITFDGSGSSDDGTPVADLGYAWDFGDGETAEGQSVQHAYASAGEYTATLTVTDEEGLTGTDSVTVTVTGAPNLVVSEMTTVQNTGSGGQGEKPKEGDKVTVVATVTNDGTDVAPASETAFTLDEEPMAGSPVGTPEIPAGESVIVELTWDTRGVKGDHVIGAVADAGDAVDESREGDNSATLEVTVRGNKVTNGDFEQANDEGTGPAGWNASDGAGSSSWADGDGSEGSHAVSLTGDGRSVALAGMPSWTSAPISVTAGELLELQVSVSADGLSSAPGVGLAYLGPAGELIDTVRLLELPVDTEGFTTLAKAVTPPPGVAEVRVVLFGFSAADLHTAGTVTFDDVGLFGP